MSTNKQLVLFNSGVGEVNQIHLGNFSVEFYYHYSSSSMEVVITILYKKKKKKNCLHIFLTDLDISFSYSLL